MSNWFSIGDKVAIANPATPEDFQDEGKIGVISDTLEEIDAGLGGAYIVVDNDKERIGSFWFGHELKAIGDIDIEEISRIPL